MIKAFFKTQTGPANLGPPGSVDFADFFGVLALATHLHFYSLFVHETSINGATVVVTDSDWTEEEAYSGTG